MKSIPDGISLLLAYAICCALTGCGSNGPRTAEVEGRVTFNNQPVTQANVIYENADRGLAYVAPLDADGHYHHKAVQFAEYTICVRPVQAKGADETGSVTGVIPTAASADPANIPKEFRSSQTTRLKATVVEGDNSFNYDLAKPQ